MKKRIFMLFWPVLLLCSCIGTQKESSEGFLCNPAEMNDSPESVQGIKTENEEDIYYRMLYTTSSINIGEIMHMILVTEAEQSMFNAAETEVSVLPDGRTLQEGVMTIDGITYRWSECDGSFHYFTDRSIEECSIETAEEMAQNFLEQLGWERSGEIRSRLLENGEVEVLCRFAYNGVKLMGQHTLFFEPGNEDELGVRGTYIKISLSAAGIHSIVMEALLQPKEILQEYHALNDFLTSEEVNAMTRQYFEMLGEEVLSMLDVDLEEISAEIIYMPYRDASKANEDILMPVFEVHVQTKSYDTTKETMVLYMDAVTGYVYDTGFEFF